MTEESGGGILWTNLDDEHRFYRSLWVTPFTFILMLFPGGKIGVFGFLIAFAAAVVQSIVYYHKWQNEDKKTEEIKND